MPRSAWVFASILSALVLAGLGSIQWRGLVRRADEARTEAGVRSAESAAARATNEVLQTLLDAARGEIAALERRVEEATRHTDDLEGRMRAELESRDITISELQGSLTVDIVDRVLFDSGRAELKPEGREILRRVADVLARYPKRQIQVIGHTDNIPIRGRTADGFSDNWGLSSGRALAAVRFLHQDAGVDPARLAAVGCGEFRPLADNATAEGRARNRRIAVVVLPERVVPADLDPPAPADGAPAPAPSPDAGVPVPATPADPADPAPPAAEPGTSEPGPAAATAPRPD